MIKHDSGSINQINKNLFVFYLYMLLSKLIVTKQLYINKLIINQFVPDKQVGGDGGKKKNL